MSKMIHSFQIMLPLLIMFLVVVKQPENLLLDGKGNLKISDFGLSALPQQFRVSIMSTEKCLFVCIWVLCNDYWFHYQWRTLQVILVKSDPGCLLHRRMGCYIRHVEHLIMLPQRSSMTKAIMEQQQICGHVVWSCSYWWLVTCHLMNPISWPYTRRSKSPQSTQSPSPSYEKIAMWMQALHNCGHNPGNSKCWYIVPGTCRYIGQSLLVLLGFHLALGSWSTRYWTLTLEV